MLFRHKYLWSLGIGLVSILIGGLLLNQNNIAYQADISQQDTTVPFTHHVHVQEVGIDCQFCHSFARRAPNAGLPSLDKCMICHNYFTATDPEAQQQIDRLINAVRNNQAPQWPDVYRQPDFVYFSHRPHISANITCVSCHGDIPNMDLVERQIDMNMGFCLDCHLNQAALQPDADITRLIDCNTCHK